MYVCEWDTRLYELNPLQSMSRGGFTAIETKSAEVIRSIPSAKGRLVMRAYDLILWRLHAKRAFTRRSFSRRVHFLLNLKTYPCWIRTPDVKTRNTTQTHRGRDTFHRMSILVYFFPLPVNRTIVLPDSPLFVLAINRLMNATDRRRVWGGNFHAYA